MEGLFEGVGAEPPAAEGHWGCGGEAPSCRRQGGLGAVPLSLKNFGAILIKITVKLVKRNVEIGCANMIKLVSYMGYVIVG